MEATELAASFVLLVLEKLGERAIAPIVQVLVRRFGKDVVQGHLDDYDVARAAFDVAMLAKFGERK